MFEESPGQWRASVTNVRAAGAYFVRAGHARSERYPLRVMTVPKIEEVKFRVTAPAYTRTPVYDGPLPQGGLAGLPGTRVDVTARSNRPLSQGSLTVFSKDKKDQIVLLPVAMAAGSSDARRERRRIGRRGFTLQSNGHRDV